MKTKLILFTLLLSVATAFCGQITLNLDAAAEANLLHGLEHYNKARKADKQLTREQYAAALVSRGMLVATNCNQCKFEKRTEIIRAYEKADTQKKRSIEDAIK